MLVRLGIEPKPLVRLNGALPTKAPSTRIRRFLYPQNFFMRIQKYLRPHVAYTNRIQPSTRIQFVSGYLKGLVNRAGKSRVEKTGSDTVTSAYTKIYRYERPHVSGYRNIHIQQAYTADTCGR